MITNLNRFHTKGVQNLFSISIDLVSHISIFQLLLQNSSTIVLNFQTVGKSNL